jgi:hypothetical protein
MEYTGNKTKIIPLVMEGQTMNLNDFIVNVFCETDDFMKQCFPKRALRRRGPTPQMTDSEVLTMEIVGEMLGFDTDKDIVGFFRDFYHHYFPTLTSRVSFIRHAANLWKVKRRLFEHITGRFRDVVTVIDSFPIPVCRFARARFSKLFKGVAAYGKELGDHTFYGFRLPVTINSLGMIQACDLAPANVHDIRMLPELTEGDRGMLLGDRAYLSHPLHEQLLAQQGLELSVPTKYSEPTPLTPDQLGKRKRLRRCIETVGSQLCHDLHVKKIWARDVWHLANRICRKILAHTFGVMFCLREKLSPLSLKKLVSI